MKDRERILGKVQPLPPELSQLIDLTANRPYLAAASSAPDGEHESADQAESFEERLFRWADEEMTPECAGRAREEFSVERMLSAWLAGEKTVSFTFTSVRGDSERLIMRFITDSETEEVLGVLSLYLLPEEEVPEEKTAVVPMDVLSLPYVSFMYMSLAEDRTASSLCVVKDDLKVFDGLAAGPYDELLRAFSRKLVLDSWREEYEQHFGSGALLQDLPAGENRLKSFTFMAPGGRLRQDAYVLTGDHTVTVCFGLLPEAAPSAGALMLLEDRQTAANAVADMEIEMQFERREMKAHTRRVALGLTLLALLIGCVGGAVLDRKGGVYTDILDQFFASPAPSETPAETAEAAVPAATAAPVIPVYVARVGSASFTAEISSNGTARTSTAITDYDTGTFTVKLTEVLGPEDFAGKYGKKYTLDGTEACVAFEVDFAANKEEDLEVVPQDAFQISLVGSDGARTEEYQLMDKEIAGSYAVSVKDGAKKTFYKRFVYSEDIDYLVLSYYKDGERNDLYFALNYTDPLATYETLKSGDKKLMVEYLKMKLADLGYYTGKISKTYDAATVAAVKKAQKDLGMEETGVADNEFQQALYAKE